MGNYINREKAINEFAIRSSFYDAEWGNKRFTLDDVEEILQSILAADVRAVVRGKWEPVGSAFPMYKCNQCHALSLGGNFCPNCGADMRDKED